MNNQRVAVVVATHNDLERTVRFLDSVAASTYTNVMTVLVDDGSTDGTADVVEELFPDVEVIRADGSLWWSASMNRGIERAVSRGATHVFIGNNDIVIDPEVIEKAIVRSIESPRSLIGSVVHYLEDPTRIWFAGARLDKKTGDILLDVASTDEGAPRETEMLTGMGTLIPVEVFSTIGLFDDRSFPQYLADSDFSLRASRSGYRLLVDPQMVVFNEVGSAWSVREFERGRITLIAEMLFSRRSPYWLAARWRFYRRYGGRGFRLALVRAYMHWARTYAAPLLKRRAKRLLG